MTIGAPLGLLTLLAVAPLVAAYFLRRRQKPLTVSALFLWRTPEVRAEAGPRFERFSRELSLLLEILAVLAATIFLADVGFAGGARGRHLVAVIDGGLSMSARGSDGRTVAERVREALARAVEEEDADLLTVIESGSPPRLLAGPSENASRALSALEHWQPLRAGHAYDPAWSLARDVAGEHRRVLFFTDAVPDEETLVPSWVEVRALGEALDNVAIVTAYRSDEGDKARVSVRIANAGAEARVVVVNVSGDREGTERTQRVEVPAAGTAQLQFGFTGAGPVTVILPDDALAEDGRVTLLASPVKELTMSLDPALDAASRAALLRFVAVSPGVKVGSGGSLSVGPSGSTAAVRLGATGELRTFVGPFFADRTHPLLEDAALGGVVWTAGQNPPGRPLISAGSTVLASEEEDGTLHLNLDLARSNVQRTPAWPVIWGNLVRRARAALPGFSRSQVVIGEELPVVVTADSTWTLRGPEGARPIVGSGALMLPAPARPGRHELLKNGDAFDALEVIAIDASESDLRDRSAGVRPASVGDALPDAERRHRPPWALLAMLALLLGDFALTTRGGLHA